MLDTFESALTQNPVIYETLINAFQQLFDHSHVLIAAGAARFLGARYQADAFESSQSAPGLPDMLERLRCLQNHRIAICGGFVRGFDFDFGGLSTLANADELGAAEFNFDQWVLDVLAANETEISLPNVQSFWFYVHEHYRVNPVLVWRLIDMDRGWEAMMCATEIHNKVEGMGPILDRLAENPDPEVSKSARAHLKQYY